MEKYKIRIKARAAKEIEALGNKKDRAQIVRRIHSLAHDPRPPGCLKLSGRYNLFRIRQGNYRIVYSVDDGEILVSIIKVADRKNAYGELG